MAKEAEGGQQEEDERRARHGRPPTQGLVPFYLSMRILFALGWMRFPCTYYCYYYFTSVIINRPIILQSSTVKTDVGCIKQLALPF